MNRSPEIFSENSIMFRPLNIFLKNWCTSPTNTKMFCIHEAIYFNKLKSFHDNYMESSLIKLISSGIIKKNLKFKNENI